MADNYGDKATWISAIGFWTHILKTLPLTIAADDEYNTTQPLPFSFLQPNVTIPGLEDESLSYQLTKVCLANCIHKLCGYKFIQNYRLIKTKTKIPKLKQNHLKAKGFEYKTSEVYQRLQS